MRQPMAIQHVKFEDEDEDDDENEAARAARVLHSQSRSGVAEDFHRLVELLDL